MSRLISILLCALSASAADFAEWGSTRWGVVSPHTVAPWADWSRGTDTGLVLWASFDGAPRAEGTTNVQPDGSRLSNDLKQLAATNTPTITGRVATFDGTDRMWTTNTQFALGSNWSVSCWARDNNGDTNAVQVIVSDYADATGQGWYLGIYQRRARLYMTSASNSTYRKIITSGNLLASGTWYHIVGVYTSGATSASVWINATNDTSSSANDTLTTVRGPVSNLLVGARNMVAPSSFIVGAVDDLRVMRWTPTPTDITNLYRWTRGVARP